MGKTQIQCLHRCSIWSFAASWGFCFYFISVKLNLLLSPQCYRNYSLEGLFYIPQLLFSSDQLINIPNQWTLKFQKLTNVVCFFPNKVLRIQPQILRIQSMYCPLLIISVCLVYSLWAKGICVDVGKNTKTKHKKLQQNSVNKTGLNWIMTCGW